MGPQFSLSGIEAQWGWGQSSVFWDLGSHGGAGVRVQSVQDQDSVGLGSKFGLLGSGLHVGLGLGFSLSRIRAQ